MSSTKQPDSTRAKSERAAKVAAAKSPPSTKKLPASKPDLADILGRLNEARCVLLCVERALSERADPSDADADPIDVDDERVTLKQAITLLCGGIEDLDRVRP
jgi:hypothetical protein